MKHTSVYRLSARRSESCIDRRLFSILDSEVSTCTTPHQVLWTQSLVRMLSTTDRVFLTEQAEVMDHLPKFCRLRSSKKVNLIELVLFLLGTLAGSCFLCFLGFSSCWQSYRFSTQNLTVHLSSLQKKLTFSYLVHLNWDQNELRLKFKVNLERLLKIWDWNWNQDQCAQMPMICVRRHKAFGIWWQGLSKIIDSRYS